METLIAPAEFFDAPEFPRCCLFTGRTDNLTVETHTVNVLARNDRTLSFQVRIPQAPFPWYVHLVRARVISFLPMLVFGYLFYLFLTRQMLVFGYMFVVAWISIVGFGALNGLLNLWLSRRLVTLRGLQVPGELQLRFPPVQQARCEQYRQALQRYDSRVGKQNPGAPPAHSGDWTAHPESTWQQPLQFEPDPDAETVPPYRLTVPVDFMNSRFLPHRCLYSGRTDRVDRILTLLHPPGTWRRRDPVTVALPQAPGAERRWDILRTLWLLVLVGVMLPIFGVALFGDHTHDRLWAVPLFLLSLFVAAAASLFTVSKTRNLLITREIKPDGQYLDLTFPARHRDTYLAFRHAWLAYQTARRHDELDAPAEPGDDPVPGAETAADNDWVDNAGADTAKDRWDETKP